MFEKYNKEEEDEQYKKITSMPTVYTQEEVKSFIQAIYSEFAELPIKMHTTYNLRGIIEQEVELHPFKPIKIFR
jgi:hypothetical protein